MSAGYENYDGVDFSFITGLFLLAFSFFGVFPTEEVE
jgi:hypothetical protein